MGAHTHVRARARTHACTHNWVLLQTTFSGLDSDQAQHLITALDENNDGKLQYAELLHTLREKVREDRRASTERPVVDPPVDPAPVLAPGHT